MLKWTRALSLFAALAVLPAVAMAQEARVMHQKIYSQNMGGRDWGFNVYLPPSYDTSNARYPVIYILHGGNSDEFGMTFIAKNYAHGFMLAQKIPEAILVFPNGGRDHFFLDRWIIRNQNENPDSHIIRELIPYIDANYRTVAARNARAIMGFSMGGYGAYHFATKYPDIFSAAGALAAGGPYGPNGLIVNYNPAEKPQALAVSNSAALRDGMRFMVAVGGRDLVQYNDEMVNILRSQNIAHEYHVLPNVGHDLGAIMNQTGLRIFEYLTAQFPAVEIASDQNSEE